MLPWGVHSVCIFLDRSMHFSFNRSEVEGESITAQSLLVGAALVNLCAGIQGSHLPLLAIVVYL